MGVVIVGMVANEAGGFRPACGEFLDTVGPAAGHLLAQSFDDPHGPQQLDGIGLTGPVHQEGVQGLGPDIPGSRPDVFDVAADGHVVGFEHLVVSVFVLGMTDHHRSNVGVIPVEARSTTRDPPCPFHDLGSQVAEQSEVILSREGPGVQATQDGYLAQAPLEIEPHAHQSSEGVLTELGEHLGSIDFHGRAQGVTTVRCM